jgi:hypothetical protein
MDPAVTQTPGGAAIDIDLAAPTQLQMSAPTEIQKTWVDSVPAEYRGKDYVTELAKHQDPATELFKQFENQRSLVGQKDIGLQVPGDQAPEHEWRAFYTKLGAPESADKYTYEAPKAPAGLEQYYKTDEKLLGFMRDTAFKSGMNQKQWDAMSKGFDNYYSEALQATHTEAQNYLKTLQDTFNKSYGEKAPQVMQAFDKAASSTPDFAKAWINAQGAEGKAAMAALFHNFATKYVGEDKLDMTNTTGGATGSVMTPAQYGDEFEKRFAALRSAEKNHGASSGEYFASKKALAELQAVGKDIFSKAV